MIFTPDSLLDAKREIAARVTDGSLTLEEASRRLLELDPDDHLSLLTLTMTSLQDGDLAQAEGYAWRGLKLHPYEYQFYMVLSNVAFRQGAGANPLSNGLMELAVRKLAANKEAFEDFIERAKQDQSEKEDVDLSDPVVLEAYAQSLAMRRDLEPQAVVERLRPYRLVHEVQAAGSAALDRELVDRIVEHGSECAPLLLGLLRGWATDEITDDGPAEASLALLGEIGDPAALPALLEFCPLDNERVAEAGDWAVGRIAKRRPAEALEEFRKFAPGATGPERAVLANHLGFMPRTEGTGEVLMSLVEDLGSIEKSERNNLFQLVATVTICSQGRRGPEMMREALRRHSGILKRDTRAECQAMVEMAESESPPELPQPDWAGRTIYEICCEEEDGQRDTRPAPTAPQRPKLPRNAPCWCGSGRKYKKCHLEADERAAAQAPPGPASWSLGSAGQELRGQVLSFMDKALMRSELEGALRLYYGPSGPDTGQDQKAEKIEFMDWLVHDYVPPRLGCRVLEGFLEQNRRRLTSREIDILERWAASHYRLVEVQKVERGVGVEIKDLLLDGVFFVRDVSASNQMARWDCFLLRVEEYEDHNELSGTALLVPRQICGPLREWILADQEDSGLDWPRYMQANSHRVRQKALELQKEFAGSFRLVSAEGDPLVFSKAVYEVLDEPALLRALESSDDLDRTEPKTFTWYEQSQSDNEMRRVLGSMRLRSDRLTLECNSRERLERGRKLLEKLCGSALKHKGDQFKGWQAAMRAANTSGGAPTSSPIPPEVEREVVGKLLREHYRKWPDENLPALGGKTPRQALSTPSGRAQVAELLKTLENGEERNRSEGRAWYDVSELRRELNIHE